MAKQKLVAKVRFDDGSKRGADNKSMDYEVGEVYQGDDAQAALDKGFLCSESDLKASKEVLDAKDKLIRELQDKNAKLNKQVDQLQKDLDAAGAGKPAKGKKAKKNAAADESGSDEEQE